MAGTQAQPAAVPLTITLFGPFEVRLDGRPLPRLRSHKEQWLLALLALRANRPVERDWLAGTLWSESEQSQAANNLRRSLWNLRQALGTQGVRLLSPTRHTVQLDLAGAWVDVRAFDAAIARGDSISLNAAVTLYSGPLLEGCTEEWVFAERQQREQSYLAAVETLAGHAIPQGEVVSAISLLRKALLMDPLRETAQRFLMKSLAASGDQAGAVLAFRDYRLLLRRELNTDPDPETVALFHKIRQEARRQILPAPASPSVPAPAPPVRSVVLPVPVTRLIGREQELEEIGVCLLASRLVTLTGTGGVGKTRLAIEVARQVGDDFAEGIWFVGLAPIGDANLVVQTVAAALGVREEAGQDLRQTLCQFLNTRQTLLVLDNCEHLLDACAQLADTLLQNCSYLRILATSRQSLGLIGEVAFRIPSLSVPPDLNRKTAGEQQPHGENMEKDLAPVLLEYEAARLFVERARQTRPAFKLSADDVEPISRICRQLDGIPLAIELAAARLKALSIEEIDARLEDRFRLLTGGSRTALPRQQTLQAALDWSYDLLIHQERLLLHRLSVFVGGWTLEAAEAVCSGETIEARQVLDILAALVDKSLVTVEEREGKTRYRLLETIRQYSGERLQASGEEKRWRNCHLQFFLTLAEAAEPELTGAMQTEWLEHLESEHDNLRAALRWSRQDEERIDVGIRLTGALWGFWDIRGYWSEGREYMQTALARETTRSQSPARAKTLSRTGQMACNQGDYPAARAFHEESLTISRQLGDKKGVANSLNNLGVVAYGQGDIIAARTLFEESLAIYRAIEDKRGIATSLNNLGTLDYRRGDYASARAFYEESLAIERELENKRGISISLSNLGNVAYSRGDYSTARTLYEESLGIRRELGNKQGISTLANNLGLVAEAQGDYATALALYEESLAIERELGNKQGIAISLGNLADIARNQGDYRASRVLVEECRTLFRELGDKRGIAASLNKLGRLARGQDDYTAANSLLEESLAIYRELGNKSGIIDSLAVMAELASRQGQIERAATLWGAAKALREAIGSPLSPKEKEDCEGDVAAARTALGETAFSAAWARGQAMSIEQAIEYALDAHDRP